MTIPASIFHRILEREGGLIDHPKDPGGLTNMGITIPTAQAFAKDNQLEVDDFREFILTLTEEQAHQIYSWLFVRAHVDLIGCEQLQDLFFDACTHHGTKRVTRWLQGIVDTVPDGILGPITAAAVNANEVVYAEFLKRRFSWIAEITVKRPDEFLVFLEGWINRIKEFIR